MSVNELINNARTAQKELETYSQVEIDILVKTIGKVVFDNAALFAEMAVNESGMGTYESKLAKKLGKSRIMWNSLKGKKSIGVLSNDPKTGITEIAKPVGIIGAIQPCTNPIVTPMANAMNAIKCANPIILSPHPRTFNCTKVFVDMIYKAWEGLKYPENVIQYIEPTNLEVIQEMISAVDVVVATGGPGMVKAAYSSGKPSYGVGPGNVQCLLDSGISVSHAIEKIVLGRTFDNGIICAGEQTVIYPKPMKEELYRELEKAHCHILKNKREISDLEKVLFTKGVINKDSVGKSVEYLVDKAGLSVEEGTKILMVPVSNNDKENLFRKEKMFPVIALFEYESFDDGLEIVLTNLEIEGKGHTVSIHSDNTAHIEKLGLCAPVSRVIVNAVSATTAGGAFTNGLNPTSTLGCGTWGNNSISENFYYKHCMNITRIARPVEGSAPSDEELWA